MVELANIPVGLLHSSHGTMAIGETPMRDVLLMEVERVNRAGGLLGRQIDPIVVDPAYRLDGLSRPRSSTDPPP